MQELERMINIYHTGFIICVVLTCVFFAASVFMFFKFDIRKIIDMKTGRGAKKTIQKMEEINAKTGKLRQDMVSHTPSVLRPEERVTYPVTEPVRNSYTEALDNSGTQETTLLYSVQETTLLSQNMQASKEVSELKLPGAFKIIKETMWVHTEEVL